MSKLKTCHVDKSHIWMANIPFCPYCNMSQDARIHGENQAKEIEKLKQKIKTRIKYVKENIN